MIFLKIPPYFKLGNFLSYLLSAGAALDIVTRYTPEKISRTARALAILKESNPRQIPVSVATIGCT